MGNFFIHSYSEIPRGKHLSTHALEGATLSARKIQSFGNPCVSGWSRGQVFGRGEAVTKTGNEFHEKSANHRVCRFVCIYKGTCVLAGPTLLPDRFIHVYPCVLIVIGVVIAELISIRMAMESQFDMIVTVRRIIVINATIQCNTSS